MLVVYSRTWEPQWGVVQLDWIRQFLTDILLLQAPSDKRANYEAARSISGSAMGKARSVDRDLRGFADARRPRLLVENSTLRLTRMSIRTTMYE